MRAGKLRYTITIQQSNGVQDEIGQVPTGWTTFAVVQASKRDLAGKEGIVADAEQDTTVTEFEIRYLEGLKASMRVVEGSDTYAIVELLTQGLRSQKLRCSRVEA